jgi:hypothetical protein
MQGEGCPNFARSSQCIFDGICVSARGMGNATRVSPSGDADEGAVVDEGATIVTLARDHQVFCSASANLIEPYLHRREPSTRRCWLFAFSPFLPRADTELVQRQSNQILFPLLTFSQCFFLCLVNIAWAQ